MENESTTIHRDDHRCLEIDKFYQAIKNKNRAFVQKFIEKNSLDILNQRIPNNDIFRDLTPDIIGNTLLHVAYKENDIDTYRLLLSFGADFTLTNNQGSTVVHQIVENSSNEYNEDPLRGRFKNPFLAATLFAHYEYRIRKNPSNRYGIAHLHAACMANSADTIVELLTHGNVSDVNQTVDTNSPYFPGYTPLHFAARCSELCTLETIKILIKYGANVNAEDRYGLTPLDILLERRNQIVHLMELDNSYRCRDFLTTLMANEKIVRFFIENCRIDSKLIVH